MMDERSSYEKFVSDKQWMACNFCFTPFSSKLKFLVLACSDVMCSSCANKYRARAEQGQVPDIMCPKCKIATKWKYINEKLEPHILKNFEPLDDSLFRTVDFQRQQIDHRLNGLVSCIKEKRDNVNNLRAKTNEIKKRTEQLETDSDIMYEQLLKYMDVNTMNDVMKTMSLEAIEQMDFQQYLRKSPIESHYSSVNESYKWGSKYDLNTNTTTSNSGAIGYRSMSPSYMPNLHTSSPGSPQSQIHLGSSRSSRSSTSPHQMLQQWQKRNINTQMRLSEAHESPQHKEYGQESYEGSNQVYRYGQQHQQGGGQASDPAQGYGLQNAGSARQHSAIAQNNTTHGVHEYYLGNHQRSNAYLNQSEPFVSNRYNMDAYHGNR